MATQPAFTILYSADARVTDKPLRAFYIGCDVGIRNAALSLLLRDIEDKVHLAGLYHIDCGSMAMVDDTVLCEIWRDMFVNKFFSEFYRIAQLHTNENTRPWNSHPQVPVRLDIETQQKQTEEAKMIMMAGMIKICFHSHMSTYFADVTVVNLSPGCATSMENQRALGCARVFGVTDRDAKKERMDEILIEYLHNHNLSFVVKRMNELLRRKRKRKLKDIDDDDERQYIKDDDRRNHVSDAFGLAHYDSKKKLEVKVYNYLD